MDDWIPLAEARRLPPVCGLYIIRHAASGKEYVGKSLNVRRRAGDHQRAKTGATYLYRAVRKHGVEAFEICLHATGTEPEMTALEVEVIAARGTFNPAGYNQTLGGDGVSGYRATAEHRAAIVARQTGRPITEEAKAKMREARLANNPWKGKKHTPESLAKISAASKVSKITPEGRASIARANASKLGTKTKPHSEETKQRLREAMTGVPKPEGFGDRFRGENNPMHGVKGSNHPGSKAVLMWPPESMLPVTFKSAIEAAAHMRCNPASVSDWCIGRYTPKNKCVWSFA